MIAAARWGLPRGWGAGPDGVQQGLPLCLHATAIHS